MAAAPLHDGRARGRRRRAEAAGEDPRAQDRHDEALHARHYGRYRLNPIREVAEAFAISPGKLILEEQGGKVLFHTAFNPCFGESLKLLAFTDFIAELTARIPPKGVHTTRRYGL